MVNYEDLLTDVQEGAQQSEYDALLSSLSDRTCRLSHSSFKAFTQSPKSFIQYKLKKKEPTDAMKFGSMVHCFVLEPEDFDNRYIVAPDVDRRTKIGKATYADFLLKVGEKEVVTHKDKIDAERIAKAIWGNPSAKWILKQCGETEKELNWEYGGFQWKGMVDGVGEKVFFDLKIIADANPCKARYQLKDMRANLQLAHYRHGGMKGKDAYVICADRSGGVSCFEFGEGDLNIAWRDIEWYMTQFKRCIFLDQWNRSYDFFGDRNGMYSL